MRPKRKDEFTMLVLDNNHGIECVQKLPYEGAIAWPGVETTTVYLPWYIKIIGCSRSGYVTRYYTRIGGWERVECNTWEAAYNHIARSRGLPTSRQVGTNYVQEARNAGVLPETPNSQAQAVLTSGTPDVEPSTQEQPWYHPPYNDGMDEVEDVMTMSKYDREW